MFIHAGGEDTQGNVALWIGSDITKKHDLEAIAMQRRRIQISITEMKGCYKFNAMAV